MFQKLALRDVGIVLATVVAWRAFAGLSAPQGMVADFVGLLVGLAVGASVYLLHEWGHALGALSTGSVLHAPSSLFAISLFSFDSKRNSKQQFVVMSLAGFAVTAAAVWFAYAVLPEGLFATRVARGAIMVLASLTVIVEVPLLVLGVFRSELPPVETFQPADSVDGVAAS